MKRRIALSIALVLSVVLVSLVSSHSTAQAQRNRSYRYDSGIITLGSNQKLVFMIDGDVDADIVFHEYSYGLGVCNGTICKHSIISESISNSIHLAIGEGASDSVAYSSTVTGTRIEVISRNSNLTATVQVRDSFTDLLITSFSFGQGQPTAF